MNVGKVDGLVTRLIRDVSSSPAVQKNTEIANGIQRSDTVEIANGIQRSDTVTISKSAKLEFEKMLKYVEESAK